MASVALFLYLRGMRAAAEILKDEFSDCELEKLSEIAKRFICDAINEARKEAILYMAPKSDYSESEINTIISYLE